MRGIVNYVRGFIYEAREFGLRAALREHRDELSRTLEYHLNWRGHGLFVRLPHTRFSAWLEWRDVNCGVSFERTSGNFQVWLGRLDMVFSVDPRPATTEEAL